MRRRVDAVLLLDKPVGITSNAALQWAKRLYRAEKAGHAGTLDPLASGLLPVLFGEAAKFAGRLLDADKEYLARVRLGATTTTGDAEGAVLEQRPVLVADDDLLGAIERFVGTIEQVPPMYSALKRAGTPLYKLARQGIEVDRAPRSVHVRALDLLERDGDCIELRILCSKGTYIRTLAADIGNALGCGAFLEGLRRTATAGFRIEAATTPSVLEQMTDEARDGCLLPVERLLDALPALTLRAEAAARFRHGQAVMAGYDGRDGERRVYAPGGSLIGVGLMMTDGELRAVRLLANHAGAAQPAEIHQKTCTSGG